MVSLSEDTVNSKEKNNTDELWPATDTGWYRHTRDGGILNVVRFNIPGDCHFNLFCEPPEWLSLHVFVQLD